VTTRRRSGATAGDPVERPLPGGIAHRGAVVRIGDTVRRPVSGTSPATHALLQHLEGVGFEGAPRFLGIDAAGREVLSFIAGSTVLAPYPAWALTDEALVSVAALLRRYHEAVAGFDAAPYPWPPSPPAAYRGELVSHNDPNLDNVVFRGSTAVGLIDWDLASPGSRLWDVAAAARMWAPLRPDAQIPDARRGQTLRRLRLFVDAYGLAAEERPRLIAAVAENQEWFRRLILELIAGGHTAFLDYWETERRSRAEVFDRWLADNETALRAALGP
jgi:hypothetical protein